jgi:4-amino-4-deoxy-L-arabinose transferase-like glycosyltransferase
MPRRRASFWPRAHREVILARSPRASRILTRAQSFLLASIPSTARARRPDARPATARLDGAALSPAMTSAMTGALPRFVWLAFGLALVLWFASLSLRPLFNPDEGRYAEIPREMLASGDWVLPRLNGLVYLEKPPLQYWATASAYAMFGARAWSARLVTALAAALGLVVVARLGEALWDRTRGLQAAAMAGSMLFYVFLGQLLTLDMLLCLWLTLAVAAFCIAQRERIAAPRRARLAMLVCWLAMAAGTLTKGLIGIVIPGAVLVLYSVVARDAAIWRHLALWPGLPLYGAVVAPWFALVERAHAGALWFLIVHEHFQRYLTTTHDRYQPWWWFVPVLGAGVLPWLPQTLHALATGWRRSVAPGAFDGPRLIWIAAVFIFVFFSASDSKLAPYVLPVLPLVALLGSGRDRGAGRLLIVSAILSLALALAAAVALAAFTRLTARPESLAIYHSVAPVLAMAAALIAGGALLALALRRSVPRAVGALAGAHFLAALLLATVGAGTLAWKYSGAPLAPALRAGLAAAPAGTAVYSLRTFDWTLPFYTQQWLVPVEYRGELDYGLKLVPERGIATLAEFVERWQGQPQAFAIVEPGELPALAAVNLPARELARTPELVLLSRR